MSLAPHCPALQTGKRVAERGMRTEREALENWELSRISLPRWRGAAAVAAGREEEPSPV